ncbi:Type VI secretion-associated protein, ImpA family [Crenothrix polyspora]|uniref:Type VI secretion-associated protein, ImpA family n=1 Tax=Crenothrix polyspora TaxID=360316 RepID=A0A1R4H7I7_9GAMM|nr:type VI secretion system protein TssA [Crenothrix polyspora]SJM91991.1 Type VI secretion-associated protein, ImpA family [Crenothrix polyspora]
MSNFVPEDFLKAISPELPCGKNLEEDPAFAQLEIDAKFIDERQMGNTVIPAVEPEWKKVRDSALALLARSRDIRIATHLTCALLRTDGFSGLTRSLALIRGLLETYWDEVYPLKDAEDDYPLLRINTLSDLKDYKKVLNSLTLIKVTQSKVGNFSWVDIKKAQDKLTSGKTDDSPGMALIDAAFLDTPVDVLKQQQQFIQQALEHSKAIIACIADKAGAANIPDWSALINQLKTIANFLKDKIPQEEEAGKLESVDSVAEQHKPAAVKMDGIHNRDEVIRTLDAICKYFERYEPSSPVPFLMIRAKKLLTMNFMAILQDLAPDAVRQAENICGVQQDDKK